MAQGILKVNDLIANWSSKQAGVGKKADAESGGPSSTHPTASADDKTVPGTEKAPGAENTAVLQEDNPKGPNTKVAEAVAASRRLAGLPKKADEPLTNVGASETGSKPEAETASAAGEGNDTGTTHPAEITNPELGGKYSSLHKLAKDIDSMGEKIACQIIALGGTGTIVPAGVQASYQQGKQAAADVLDDPGAQALLGMVKEAAFIAKETADFLDMYKKSNDGMMMDPAMMAGGGDPAAAGGAPPTPAVPDAAAAGAAPGGVDPDLAALGISTPEEAEALLAAIEGGGAGGAGGDPAAGGAPDGGQPALEQLLMSLGIDSPEKLQALLQQVQGGGGGGMPPNAGSGMAAAPPAEPAAPSGPPAEGGGGGGESEPSSEKKDEGESKEGAAKQPQQSDVLRKVSATLRERLNRGAK